MFFGFMLLPLLSKYKSLKRYRYIAVDTKEKSSDVNQFYQHINC